jgi:hypothetical protein
MPAQDANRNELGLMMAGEHATTPAPEPVLA